MYNQPRLCGAFKEYILSRRQHIIDRIEEGSIAWEMDLAPGDELVAINGLEDFIVIDTEDVLLICPKDEKKFKDFVSGLGMPGYEKYK